MLRPRLLRCWDYLKVLPRLRWFPNDLNHPLIVIVDRTGASVISELIPKDIDYWVLPVRDEERYINWRILIYFLAHLPWVLMRRVNMLGLYVLSVANQTQTGVLITFIDNCNWDKGLHDVASLRVITVQNGLRTPQTISRKQYDVFLGFSRRDTNAAHGTANEAIPVGSVRLGLAYKDRRKEVNEKEHIVSSTLFDSLSNIVTVITLRLEKRMETDVVRKVMAAFPLSRTPFAGRTKTVLPPVAELKL